MDGSGAAFAIAEFAMRETALFAAFGFLILGMSDLAVDLLWLGHEIRRRPGAERETPPLLTRQFAPTGRLAVFVPAWDEARVIGDMLRHALNVWRDDDLRIYVGCYPNDPETIAAVTGVNDERVRAVVGPVQGPTSKADCINRLFERMVEDEAREGAPFRAVILHDAEDVVHSMELRLFAELIDRFDLVQLPVLPLIDRQSRWIGGHYADEFAESHGKELVVRQAIGASLPSAGVGCAISRNALDRLVSANGLPFDPASVTEDYELGLRLGSLGGRSAFVRRTAGGGRATVSTRGYFPATLTAAVNQKARWMTGIAMSGWDRLGWSGGLCERWMRFRDRQSLLAALILFAGYLALASWLLLAAAGQIVGRHVATIPPLLAQLMMLNAGLLLWRLAMRAAFVTRSYGWREGIRSVPRVLVGNLVAMLAARRAVARYLASRRTGFSTWDKTDHAFPQQLPAE